MVYVVAFIVSHFTQVVIVGTPQVRHKGLGLEVRSDCEQSLVQNSGFSNLGVCQVLLPRR